ncbi:MAG: NAD-dependent epimerase/dehydratase family protein [Sphingomonadales bacterium]|nr:NAD-dependent epimerase/dehydratase family protein [Sphingomonadales bacterium]
MYSPVHTLILGSEGQLGSELRLALQEKMDPSQLLCTDLKAGGDVGLVRFETLDVLDFKALEDLFERSRPRHVYLLAAMLSAKGETNPHAAWKLNMDGLIAVLDLSLRYGIERVFWPSSIAVFGPESPRDPAVQAGYMDPQTVYGISKLSGELWCRYYHTVHGLDVRSLRYPGIISWRTLPGGGTTDYAVDIFHQALASQQYTCFLQEDSRLPMIYIDDAIRGTLELMNAPTEHIRCRTSYNLGAMDFTPGELAAEIRHRIPSFTIQYAPDFRQVIANQWPMRVDDRKARADWGWSPRFDLAATCDTMLAALSETSSVAR